MKRYYILFIVFLSANLFSQKTNFDNSNNNTINTNNVGNQNPQMVFPFVNNVPVRDIVLTNDNKYVATCLNDLISINEVNSGKVIYRIKGTKIAFSPNNKYFVVASYNGDFQLYDFKTGLPLFETWNSGGDFPRTLVFSPKSNQLLTNSRKGITINTIGEKKITHKIFKETKGFTNYRELQSCNFDNTGAVIILPSDQYGYLNFYNSTNFKLEKKLNLDADYSIIYSVLNIDSTLYVVGENYDSDRADQDIKREIKDYRTAYDVHYTVFRKYILDQKRNIISSKTIEEGAYWEKYNEINFIEMLTRIQLIKNKIALYKKSQYSAGESFQYTPIVSIYSIENDSELFDLRAEQNREEIQAISDDMSFAVIHEGSEAYSKRINIDTILFQLMVNL